MTLWAGIPLVSCSIFAILAVVVLRQDGRRVNLVFARFLIASSVWSFTSFMLHLNVYPQYALLWNEILVAALVWTVVSYYHFVRAYDNRAGGVGVYLGYGSVFTILALSLSGHIIKYAFVINGVLYHNLGASLYIVGGISAVFLISATWMLVRIHSRSTDAIDRNRTMYLVIGSVVVIVSSYVTNLTPAIAGLSIEHVGNMINALIIAYAITKYQLLNIRFVARKVLAYGLLAGCLGGIFAGVLFLEKVS